MEINHDTIKKYSNKKSILGVLAVLLGVAVIFVTSIVPLAIDPSKWNTREFISNEIVQVAITLLGEVSCIMTAQAVNGSDPRSKLAKAKVRFNESLDKNVGDRVFAFTQWVRYVLQPKDLSDKYFRLLRSAGIENKAYLNLSRSDLKSCLNAPMKIDDKFYRQINPKQYKLLIEILNGKHGIDFVSPETYLKLSKLDLDKNSSEKLSNQTKKTTLMMLNSIVRKTLSVLAVGLVFGALIPTGVDKTVGETLTTLFSRLMTFGSASFVGYFVGCEINDVNAEYIEERILTHIKFKEDKTFVPKTEEEIAKQEFKLRVKKENEEQMAKLGILELKGEDV